MSQSFQAKLASVNGNREMSQFFHHVTLGTSGLQAMRASLKRVSISSALMHTACAACMNACTVACDRTGTLQPKNREVSWKLKLRDFSRKCKW